MVFYQNLVGLWQWSEEKIEIHLDCKVRNFTVNLESSSFCCFHSTSDHVYKIFFLLCSFSFSFVLSLGLCPLGGSAVTLYLLPLPWWVFYFFLSFKAFLSPVSPWIIFLYPSSQLWVSAVCKWTLIKNLETPATENSYLVTLGEGGYTVRAVVQSLNAEEKESSSFTNWKETR